MSDRMRTDLDVPGLAEVADGLADQLLKELGPALEPADFTPPLADFVARRAVAQVVVGGPRAGKTLLSEHYERAVLAQRGSGEPVPMSFDLEAWRTGTSVGQWLVQTITNRLVVSRELAGKLLSRRLIHPIFDGVDQLAAARRARFLREVRELRLPVLLTSRRADLGDWLSPIQLEPPPLHATLRHWEKISEEVRRDPSGPLALALSDPVNRFAFDSTYSRSGADPSGLLDRSAFHDQSSIERHLLDGLSPESQGWLQKLASRARTGEERLAWWELAHVVPLTRVRVVAGVAGLAVADHTRGWIKALFAAVTGAALPLAGQILIFVCVALVVAGGSYHAVRSSRPVPVRLSLPLNWGWFFPGLFVFAGTAGLMYGLGGEGWSVWPAALAVAALSALRMTVDERAEDDMDSPVLVLWQDLQVLLLRLLLALIVVYLLPVAFGADIFAYSSSGVLAVVATSVVWSASARCGFGGSALLALFLPVRSELHALVRRQGGIYLFRDEATLRRLAEPQFKQLVAGTVRSTAIQVSVLRHVVADEVCRRLGVDGVLSEQSAVREFKDRIAAEIGEQADALVASTAETRRLYVVAKARYVKRYLRMEWDDARFVSDLWMFSVGSFVFGWAVLTMTWMRFGLWSPLGAGALTVAATATVLAFVGSVRWDNRRFYRMSGGAAFVTVLALLAAGVLDPVVKKADTWIIVVSGVFGVVCLFAAWPLSRLGSQVDDLASDDPQEWPTADETHRAKEARHKAVRAHRVWLDALVERVLPLAAERLAREKEPSYATVLPPAEDMPGLGDVTSVAQYVPTETSKRLAGMMTFMSRGAIGISGPRGVGKSSVLNVIGVLGLGARPDDLALQVSAPTNYVPRDFVVHLYAKLCRTVLESEPDSSPKPRRWSWLVASVAGVVIALGGWQWPRLVATAGWVPQNWRLLVIAAGVTIAVVSSGVWAKQVWAVRRPDDDVASEALRRLENLRFIETTTVTRAITAKPPAVAEFGGSQARALAGQTKTLPELVEEFKAFLTLLTERMRAEPKGRIVVCIDELDKISSPVDAERFLNDIKAVFGVERCFFLVTVSDEALTAFSARSLTMRTAFDSAFDSVLRVSRFALSDTRLLLMQRAARLSEPFVWLCHVLSGGLPRDLNRTTYDLYDLLRKKDLHDLGALTGRLVRADIQAVTESMAARLTDRFDAFAVRLRRHVVNVGRLDLTSATLTGYERLYPPPDASDDLLLINEQLRAYLGYVAAVLRLFCENTEALLAGLKAGGTDPVESLALARTWLATDPVAAAACVQDWTQFENRLTPRAV